jgi:hypothetical protein
MDDEKPNPFYKQYQLTKEAKFVHVPPSTRRLLTSIVPR